MRQIGRGEIADEFSFSPIRVIETLNVLTINLLRVSPGPSNYRFSCYVANLVNKASFCVMVLQTRIID